MRGIFVRETICYPNKKKNQRHHHHNHRKRQQSNVHSHNDVRSTKIYLLN
jgi:hypothetical protein